MTVEIVEKAKEGLYGEDKAELLQEALEDLEKQEIKNVQDLKQWLDIRDEITRHMAEALDRSYINFNSYNDNEDYKKRFQYDQEILTPIIDRYANLLNKKFYDSPYRKELGDYYGLLSKRTANAIELFREENIPLGVEENNGSTQYFDITGSMTVMWEGEEKTLPEMNKYLKDADRTVREKAWKAIQERRLQDAEKLDEVMDRLVALRDQIAKNAGCKDYVEYKFKELERFDYTPEDCETFHESVKKYVVPLLNKIQQKHQQELGIDSYRPWDVEAVLPGEKPLRPFETTDELVEGALAMLKATDEFFYQVLKSMKEGNTLDLNSRKAKSPGGFCTFLPVTELPFIFMNAANSQDDLSTLVHESGHSVHDMLCREQILSYTNIPSEIAEVASMSMELLTMDKWGQLYKDKEELKRAVKEQLEGVVATIAWVMVVDKFQLWLYRNPQATPADRNEMFKEIVVQYTASYVDWSGYEKELANFWKKQLHIFEVPFYYIEYAIAQLGALQLWRNYKKSPKEAIESYKKALSLGSSKSLPELYSAMGIKFDFSEETIKELMNFLWKELESVE